MGTPPPIPQTARPLHRPVLVAILAVLLMLGGALLIVVGLLLAVAAGILGGLVAGAGGLLVGAALGAVVLIGGVLMLVAGLGLWGMRSWAWWLAAIVLVIELLYGLRNGGVVGPVLLGLFLVYLIAVRRNFNQ